MAPGLFRLLVALIAVMGLAACTDRPADQAVPSPSPTAPQTDPAGFVATIDNSYLPLTPGTRWVYESKTEDGLERIVVEVTTETKAVMGVNCVVVRDTVTLDGNIIEDTSDWYAQDRDGNVWYLGEDTKEYEDGKVVSTKGSWEAGVDGAQPGIAMKADPKPGDEYRQEYYPGQAEDMGKVLRLGDSVTVPYGSFSDVLVTEDFTPLEPGVAEQKYYAPGVGLVLEVLVSGGTGRVELVEFSRPGS
jgi:energy-converting hydrogenase Eha subunit F